MKKEKIFEEIKENFNEIKTKKPLILNITNFVTMDFMANVLLALGAAPIMSQEVREIEELVRISSAVNINIGTLDKKFITLAKLSRKNSLKYHIPFVVDPVGVGASKIRTRVAKELIQGASVIRGNASEIIGLHDAFSKERKNSKGVESSDSSESAINSALKLSKKYKTTILVSGKNDFIANETSYEKFEYGSEMMTLVTGMGCVLTAVVAAFCGVMKDHYKASCLAIVFYSLIGQNVAEKVSGPGSLRSHFIDEIYKPNWDELKKKIG